MDVASTNFRSTKVWCLISTPKSCFSFFIYRYRADRFLTNLLFRALLSIFISISFVNHVKAQETNILFIKSGSAAVYNQIIQASKSHLSQICNKPEQNCSNHSIQIVSIGDIRKLRKTVRNQKLDLIITIGTKAAIQLVKFKTTTPTLYSLIPSHSYRTIKKASASKSKSAIYIDQPIKRQLQLIKNALPKKKRVGAILGKHSGVSKKRLQRTMRNMGLTPVIANLDSGNIGATLNSIYKKIDVLLAIPDPSVYNKKTVMNVLLSSYRHNIPVIGYSAAFARSGATASIFSSPRDIGYQIGEEIVSFISSNNRRLSPAGFPNYFSIKTNMRVIRSLKLGMPPTRQIKSGIKKAK
jgi:ABC-type uncharacterized transport system substrate-binding protein